MIEKIGYFLPKKIIKSLQDVAQYVVLQMAQQKGKKKKDQNQTKRAVLRPAEKS